MTDHQTTPLLELDPDLGRFLPEERLAAATHELLVAVRTLETGPWDVDRLSASPDHLGLLVLDGILAREVLVLDTVSTELLGPGDTTSLGEHRGNHAAGRGDLPTAGAP